MRILVLGAGVIGVTTAWYLQARGHQVTVIERQPESAMETSFANGGQLSYSHAAPWASPTVLPKVLKWMWKKDAPLVFNLRADFLPWGIQFLMNCTTAKSQFTTRNIFRLAAYSKEQMAELLNYEPIEFHHLKQGIIHIFHDEKSLAGELVQAKFQKEFGCDYQLLTPEECYAKEPALKASTLPLVGGIFYPMDESGDVHLFTQRLAVRCAERGVRFLYDTPVEAVVAEGNEIAGVKAGGHLYTADSYVMALGSYSPILLKPLGLKLPIYPMKGYSISIPVGAAKHAPTISVTDQSYKVVISRLGDVIRVAGTAEFGGYNQAISDYRIASLRNLTMQLFPECGDVKKMSSWACLRSSTPDNAPILGPSPFSNLFLNTGQGSLGWTLACGSAKVVADCIEGRKPAIDLTGLTLERYRPKKV